jgi:hypothetical protein
MDVCMDVCKCLLWIGMVHSCSTTRIVMQTAVTDFVMLGGSRKVVSNRKKMFPGYLNPSLQVKNFYSRLGGSHIPIIHFQ